MRASYHDWQQIPMPTYLHFAGANLQFAVKRAISRPEARLKIGMASAGTDLE
jgi:hypothetical protein